MVSKEENIKFLDNAMSSLNQLATSPSTPRNIQEVEHYLQKLYYLVGISEILQSSQTIVNIQIYSLIFSNIDTI